MLSVPMVFEDDGEDADFSAILGDDIDLVAQLIEYGCSVYCTIPDDHPLKNSENIVASFLKACPSNLWDVPVGVQRQYPLLIAGALDHTFLKLRSLSGKSCRRTTRLSNWFSAAQLSLRRTTRRCSVSWINRRKHHWLSKARCFVRRCSFGSRTRNASSCSQNRCSDGLQLGRPPLLYNYCEQGCVSEPFSRRAEVLLRILLFIK